LLVAVATGATVMSSHKTPQIFSRRSEERPVGTFAQHRKQGPQGVLHIPGKPRPAPRRRPPPPKTRRKRPGEGGGFWAPLSRGSSNPVR